MTDDILCPTCGHSLAFHKFDYGTCEAPLGGLTSKNLCGCPLTLHTYIQNRLQKDTTKEIEQLEIRYLNCMDEIVGAHAVLVLAQKKIEFLELKLKNIRELLDKTKLDDEKVHPILGRLGINYRNISKIIDDIILELEKDMVI